MALLTPENIKQYYKKLPERVKEAYSSADITNTLQEIGKKHKLHVDKLGEFIDETGLVMLGVTHPSEYIGNIKKRLGVDSEQARAVAQDVNEQIFKPIREELKKVHNIGESAITEEKEKREKAATREAGIRKQELGTIQPAVPAEVPVPLKKEAPAPDGLPVVEAPSEPAAEEKPIEPALAPEQIVPTPPVAKPVEEVPIPQKPMVVSRIATEEKDGEKIDKDELLAEISKPTPTPISITAQKLAGTAEMPREASVHTEEGVERKTAMPSAPVSQKYEIDPYRESID